MFWADRITDEICTRFERTIRERKPLVIRDEKTASGRVHVGSMRGVAIHGVVAQLLAARGVAVEFLYEINDLDPMDDIPGYLDEATYKPYLMRPLRDVPSPEPGVKNFAEYYGGEFIDVIRHTGFTPTFYRASELYGDGRMNDLITTALKKRDGIRDIYKRISGSEKKPDWFPVTIVAQVCKGLPTVVGFSGGKLQWVCTESGEEGEIAPYDGAAKLAWKVEWAAKFSAVNVDIEGAGKDHSTKGGSRDVAAHISKEIFNRPAPFDIPYEFFLVGGRKMSSSKGRGSSAKEIADLLPPHIFRLALLGKEPKRAIDFEPDGDTIPLLYDEYDRIATKVWSGAQDDSARLFEALHPNTDDPLRTARFLPRFSQVAFLVQMPHMDIEEACVGLKGAALTEEDKRELRERVSYATHWLSVCAPEEYRYVLQENEVPVEAQALNEKQKDALMKLQQALRALDVFEGQTVHTLLHDIRKETEIDPKEFFSALYLAFLGRPSGPKAGWFLSTLNRDFVLRRLEEVV